MKKLIVILTVALINAMAAFSQNDMQTNQENIRKSNEDYAKHRFLIYGSTGYGNSIYDGINESFIHSHYSFSSALELKYAFFFAPKWGFSIGMGVSRFDAKATLNIEGVIPHYNDPVFDPSGQRYYDLYYQTNNLVEKQRIYALEAPLQFHFEHHIGRNGIFASLGARGYFPISAQSVFPQGQGTLTTKGYEEFTDTWYTDPPHFGERDARATPAKVKLNPYSVDAIAEFGGIFPISHKCDFYVGVYGSYGFMDVLPKAADKKNFITPEQNNGFAVNSLLASNFLNEYNKYIDNNNLNWKKVDEKWNRWQIGVKVGLHIKFGGKKYESEKSGSKNKRGNNVTLVHDTVRIVSIYNMSPIAQTDDNDLVSSEKESSISTLTNVLSNSKILFDLDSDVPKIDDKNFIVEATEILKKEPALRLIIEGYTCELGTEKHNRALATQRANAIRNLFIEQGVAPEQIQTAAYTAKDLESKQNIIGKNLEAHRTVIFRIIKGN